ncbi:hypothetical protein DAI22_01g016800 [Oryza sativa Japonica Group]|nr:hypothetical protein DAI22_01g016800 [Oryza sativa Japonica Group]
MMERSLLPWLLLLLCFADGVFQSRAQPDSKGFISIDCGIQPNTSYVHNTTKISYVADDDFTDGGSNYNVSPEYIKPQLSQRYYNLRAFPDGARNCYTARSLAPGIKYLIRASFLYGNYDGLNKLPVFHLYIGVNFWTMVNITSLGLGGSYEEAIVVVPDDFVQVCLINTGTGTPFISSLELRPLDKRLYPQVNATLGLLQLNRLNFGPTDNSLVRYPDDPHDRFWGNWDSYTSSLWKEISTASRVDNLDGDIFDAPTAVMQTAVTPRNASGNIYFFWEPWPQPNDPTPPYTVIFHFSELEILTNNASRQFYINLNGEPLIDTAYEPTYLTARYLYGLEPLERTSRYNITINATANSTLPPLINAAEIFSIISTAVIGTDSQDASSMMAIKDKYQVKKNWMGDPCMPKTFAWDKLTCSYPNSSGARIISLNLSSSGLSADISSAFGNLKALQYLDLSNNSLTGSIPDVLSQLPSLRVLDLTGNQLSGSIPSGILKRIQDGSLNVRYGNNPNLCINGNSCKAAKKKSKLAIYTVIPAVLVVLIASVTTLFCLLRRKKQGPMNNSLEQQNEMSTSTSHVLINSGYGDNVSLRLENRRFTYKELEKITNKFKRVLGRGGFGYVYHGFLEDGTQVAVKLRSESSSQGAKEFLIEAQILTRIHHKNLVSMISYCKDGIYMALVYEYMPEGTLEEHIVGENKKGKILNMEREAQYRIGICTR